MSQVGNKQRNNELAMIHIAKVQLGLDDDTYRQMLWTVARVSSSKDLDFSGREAVLKHMNSRGFKPKSPSKARQTIKLSDAAQHQMIRGLWLQLHAEGVVIDPSEQAVLRFVKNQKKVERMEWLSVRQASDLIEALKDWLAREARKKAISGE